MQRFLAAAVTFAAVLLAPRVVRADDPPVAPTSSAAPATTPPQQPADAAPAPAAPTEGGAAPTLSAAPGGPGADVPAVAAPAVSAPEVAAPAVVVAAPGVAVPDPGAASSVASPAPVLAAPPPPLAAPAVAAGAEADAPPTAIDASKATAVAKADAPPRKPWRTLPLIGLSLGAGFPDLANLNLLVRPLNWVRLYGGPSWSYLSWGLQGGVVLSPINWYVNPTLSFQAGKLFRTNASRFVNDDPVDGRPQRLKPLASKIDYHYYAGDLGLELGSPRGFNFFLRFGLSFVVVKANGTGTTTSDDGTVVSVSNPKVSAWLPSAKLGFQYWF